MATLFISDLHLSGERPATAALFRRFLDTLPPEVGALYILGDLFEAWLGDDVILPPYEGVLEALREVADRGVFVGVQHGNRDFLLGEGFTERTQARLLPDPATIDLHGTPTLLMHGDLLCTDDLPYQEMRKMLRDPAWLAAFLAKAPAERLEFARQLRERSAQEITAKAQAIMDANPSAVANAFRQFGVRRIIHGHTHRRAVHQETVDGAPCERIVLGEWSDGEGNFLRCDAQGCRLHDFR